MGSRMYWLAASNVTTGLVFIPPAYRFAPLTEAACGVATAAAFDRFIEVETINDLKVAKLLRELEIDIVIDLDGNFR